MFMNYSIKNLKNDLCDRFKCIKKYIFIYTYIYIYIYRERYTYKYIEFLNCY